jgi:oligoribonuclease (3'-5' exoribonuclease)
MLFIHSNNKYRGVIRYFLQKRNAAVQIMLDKAMKQQQEKLAQLQAFQKKLQQKVGLRAQAAMSQIQQSQSNASDLMELQSAILQTIQNI